MKPTDVNQFVSELGAGVVEEKLATIISLVASQVVATDKQGDINVVFNPYDGFEERQLDIGVSAKLDRNDEIRIRLRVRGFERLKLLIAEEFAKKLVSGLSETPIIGTIEPA